MALLGIIGRRLPRWMGWSLPAIVVARLIATGSSATPALGADLADATAFRIDFGFRADDAWVRQSLADRASSPSLASASC